MSTDPAVWQGDGELWPTSHQQTGIRYDLFPAQIADPDTPAVPIRGRLRVVIGGSEVFVFAETPQFPGLALLRRVPMRAISGAPATGFLVSVADSEETFLVQKDPGCGCGSRLRGMQPFANVYLLPT